LRNRNNPLRFTNPDGHCIEDFCMGEAFVIGALLKMDGGLLSNIWHRQSPTLGSWVLI